jgi:hypothetical protein
MRRLGEAVAPTASFSGSLTPTGEKTICCL